MMKDILMPSQRCQKGKQAGFWETKYFPAHEQLSFFCFAHKELQWQSLRHHSQSSASSRARDKLDANMNHPPGGINTSTAGA